MDPIFEDDSMEAINHKGVADEITVCPKAHQTNQPNKEYIINDESLDLPVQMCEDAAILSEMLSYDLLAEVLEPEDKQQLLKLMPKFQRDDEAELEKTWIKLFSNHNFKFGNPVENFCRNIQSGIYTADAVQIRKRYQKLQQKHAKQEQRSYYFNLLQSIIISRQQLIEAAAQLPPGQNVRIQTPNRTKKSVNLKSCIMTTEERVKKRYFDELRAIDCFSSEDDNYPEGPPAPLSKKQRRHLCTVQGSLSNDIFPIQSTLAHEIYNRPILIDKPDKPIDEDGAPVKSSAFNGEVSVSKPQETPPRKVGYAKRDDWRPVIDILSRVSANKNPYDINEESFKSMLARYRGLRKEGKITAELDLTDMKTVEVGERVRMCSLSKKLPPARVFEMPKKKIVVSASNSSDEAESDVEMPKKMKTKKLSASTAKLAKSKAPKSRNQESGGPTLPESVELERVAIFNEVEINSFEPEPPQAASPLPKSPSPSPASPTPPVPAPSPPPPPCLTQDTHSSFFALLREISINNDGPLTVKQFLDAIVVWSSSPITPLNEWYSQLMLVHQKINGWAPLIQSALDFLVDQGLATSTLETGQAAIYSWSGDGRDSEALLQDLSGIWLQQHQDSSGLDTMKLETAVITDLNDSMLHSPPDPTLTLGTGLDLGEEMPDISSSTLLDTPDVVHPPRSVTTWTVRPSTEEEKVNYREQERQRYNQPHKAFTFRQHGYESIVGPVKGVYTPGQGLGQPSTKVRGHNLMVPDRPACVTLLSLVRDAAARLPNGEGTRAEICELMKESQYLAPGAEASLHSVVSGALDRLHYEADPCVKYDSARKVWIYLHRHRSEAEFEQIHKQHQGMPSRVKKPRSEQRRTSGVGNSPASKASKLQTNATNSASTSVVAAVAPATSIPVAPPSPAVPEMQISSVATSVPLPVTVLKSSPIKLNSTATMAIRPDVSKAVPVPIVVASTTAQTSTVSTPITSASAATSGPATIQTFQITTSTGVQTIRVAAPANLPTALLARTLQISAQQQGGLAGQKVIGTPTLVNGTSAIKQVILSPTSAKGAQSAILTSPRAASTSITQSSIPIPASSPGSIIRLNIPAGTTSLPGIVTTSARARLPVSPVRLTGRQQIATSATSATTPVQTFLIRPPTPVTTSTTSNTVPPSTTSAPRLVMVNNKLINLSTTPIAGQLGPNTRVVRPANVAINMASMRKTVASNPAAATTRPMLARVVSGTSGSAPQQQMISLENLISLSNAQKAGAKTGVVQLPLSAIAGLNVGTSPSSSNQPTTVLLQNVKGAQSILLPAGFQGGTINIRGVRLATVAPQQQTAGQQAKQGALVTRLVTPQQPPPSKTSDL